LDRRLADVADTDGEPNRLAVAISPMLTGAEAQARLQAAEFLAPGDVIPYLNLHGPGRKTRATRAAIHDLVLPWRDTDRRSADHQHLLELLCPVFRLHRELVVIQGDRLAGLDGPFERGDNEAVEVPVLRGVDTDVPTLVRGHLGPAVVGVGIHDRNLGL